MHCMRWLWAAVQSTWNCVYQMLPDRDMQWWLMSVAAHTATAPNAGADETADRCANTQSHGCTDEGANAGTHCGTDSELPADEPDVCQRESVLRHLRLTGDL